MLFTFLKYIQPTIYFQLYRKDGTSIFPVVTELPEAVLQKLEADEGFQSSYALDYDISWQAIQKGYVGEVATYTSFQKVSIADEYRFLKKYFHPVWVFYVLVLRLVTFKNPITEIKAWLKTRGLERVNNFNELIEYPDWKDAASLLEKQPLISVIIPTLNRYAYLKDVLHDFEKQDYKNFEIVVVDQSEPFKKEFYDQFSLTLNVIHQEEKALWLARNTAIQCSKGDFIALSEDDVRIGTSWLSDHLKCLDFFKADISAGVFYPENSQIPKERSFFAIASQFATGNSMLRKNVFKEIGLFDRQFEKQRMGDGEFGIRAYLNGYKSVSNPFASCIDVKAGTGGLRQMGSWDAFRPKNLLAPRPIPSVLYLYRKYYGKKRSILAMMKTVPPSIMPYRYKKNKKMLVLGMFISLFLFPLVVLQVYFSWKQATKKLQQGALIGELK